MLYTTLIICLLNQQYVFEFYIATFGLMLLLTTVYLYSMVEHDILFFHSSTGGRLGHLIFCNYREVTTNVPGPVFLSTCGHFFRVDMVWVGSLLCFYILVEKKLRATATGLQEVSSLPKCFRFRFLYTHQVFQTEPGREEKPCDDLPK